ncbi:MAP6 domain-containing protein 1 [Anolis sagrei]|uniref:MAP6 domain-containing protein 1 n=1 Tax=Anolis sagrei TaxID=38937 RepID=UPI00352111DE
MAWPCISRVCCLARFWNQMDKSDLAVPLTIHNYSDIEEEEAAAGAATGGGMAPHPPPKIPTGGSSSGSRSHAQPALHPPRGSSSAAPLPVSASAPSLHQHPHHPHHPHHHPSQEEDLLGPSKRPSKRSTPRRRPAAAETQYQQDFRAWPLQKRDALPWVGEARGRVESPRPEAQPSHANAAAAAAPSSSSHAGIPGAAQSSRVYVLPVAVEGEPVGGKEAGYKPLWPHAASSPPPGAAKHTSSSYRQEYRPWSGAKRSRPTKTTQGFIIPEDHFAPESSYKADFKIPEVKGKFSPNPSAVFQAPSRILNV